MRLIVTGKSRSAKSSALHRLTRTALTTTWANVLIADGKSVELLRYANDRLHVYGEDEVDAFAEALTAAAERLTARYQALRGRGLSAALPGDPRELIIVDEIQEFTRHSKVGKDVKAALTRIFEKSGALGDLVIIATQRATNAIPPSTRHNASAQLRMLGVGYFQLVADGFPTRQGRVEQRAPLTGATQLNPADLMDVLSAQADRAVRRRTRALRGIGGAGARAGRRHAPTRLPAGAGTGPELHDPSAGPRARAGARRAGAGTGRSLGDQHAEVRARWTVAIAYAMGRQDYQAAAAHSEQALTLARTLDMREEMAFILNMGWIYTQLGRPEAAVAALEEAAVLWRELGNILMQADALVSSGYSLWLTGHYAQATRVLDEALPIHRSLQNDWGLSTSGQAWAHVCWEQGQVDRAIALATEAMRAADRGGHFANQINNRCILGVILAELGAVEEGLERSRQAVAIAQAHDHAFVATSLAGLAWVEMMRGNLSEAAATLTKARQALERRVSFPFALSQAVTDSEERQRLLGQAQATIGYIAEHIGDPQLLATFLNTPPVQAVLEPIANG